MERAERQIGREECRETYNYTYYYCETTTEKMTPKKLDFSFYASRDGWVYLAY